MIGAHLGPPGRRVGNDATASAAGVGWVHSTDICREIGSNFHVINLMNHKALKRFPFRFFNPHKHELTTRARAVVSPLDDPPPLRYSPRKHVRQVGGCGKGPV